MVRSTNSPSVGERRTCLYDHGTQHTEMIHTLLMVGLITGAPALAQGLSLDALLDDTGAAPDPGPTSPTALWPVHVTVDHVYRTVSIDWETKPDETLPFAAIVQIEHARAWDGKPEELFVIFQDGRRIAMSEGAEVPAQVELMRAWLSDRITELPAGTGHSARTTRGEGPQLTVTAAGVELRRGHLLPAPAGARSPISSPQKSSCDDCIRQHDLDRVVKQRMGAIRGCMQQARLQDPSLAGEVVIRFQVTASGAIGTAAIKRSTLENSVVESCIREQFLKMVFPRPPGNKVIHATYPVVFAPSR